MGNGGWLGKSDAMTGRTQYTHILYKGPGHIPHRWIMNTKLICKPLYFYIRADDAISVRWAGLAEHLHRK